MPALHVQIAAGSNRLAAYRSRHWNVLVLSHEACRLDRAALLEHVTPTVDVAIVDEASVLRNPGETSASIAAVTAPARWRVALTATPIENGLADLYQICRWVDRRTFLSREHFDREYVIWRTIRFPVRLKATGIVFKKKVRIIKKYRRLADVRFKIAPLFIRRTAREVAVELPAVVLSRELVELGPEQRRVYELVAERTRAELQDDAVGEPLFESLVGLRQATDAAALVPEGEGQVGSAKLDRLRELLEGEFAAEQVLVFTDFAEFAKLACRELREFSPVMFVGEMGRNARRIAIDGFRTGARRLMVATKAAERGLNLQFAGVLVNLDMPWNPAALKQRIGRLRRLKSEHATIRVRDLVGADTIEERLVLRVLHGKGKLFRGVFGDDELAPGGRAPRLTGRSIRRLI